MLIETTKKNCPKLEEKLVQLIKTYQKNTSEKKSANAACTSSMLYIQPLRNIQQITRNDRN